MAFQGQQVTGPLTAYVQADIINTTRSRPPTARPTPSSTRTTRCATPCMQASFLRASLFTSVVAYGVALFAAAMGVLAILFGWAFLRLASAPVVVKQARVA